MSDEPRQSEYSLGEREPVMSTTRLLLIQRLCFGIGAVLLSIWMAAWAHAKLNSERDLAAFAAARAAVAARAAATATPPDTIRLAAAETASGAPAPQAPETGAAAMPAAAAAATVGPSSWTGGAPDTSLWSPGRVDDYQASLAVDFDAPEGVLHIPKISLSVPVLQGTDDLTLNRAVGRIPGTARIGATRGNLGIAGHRDSFFRGLKDIGPGDTIRLETLWNTLTYEVADITITTPSDTSVLERSDDASLTLVTCYPFYHVGHAPKRYIVRAVLVDKETT